MDGVQTRFTVGPGWDRLLEPGLICHSAVQEIIRRGLGGFLGKTELTLLDELITCWACWDSNERYYLEDLAPRIVCFDERVQLMEREKEIVDELHLLLSPAEWQRLPELIRDRRERPKRKKAAVDHLSKMFGSYFLDADKVFNTEHNADFISRDEYEERRTKYVQDWVKRELGQELDSEQAAAVAASGGDVLVVARAGSGKTKTLITRAIFLQKHCNVSPHELLLLAFNRKAAEEMKSRLAKVLGDQIPYVMTFHALALALVHPEEEILFDGGDADQQGLSREVQEIIDEQLTSKEHRIRIRDLMLAHFRDDWERIEAGPFHLAKDELLAYRRSLPRESLKGDYVKSFGEKVIANALFENGVEYRYERNFRWDGANYRPDFTIPIDPKGGVVIEYFGLEGDPDYDYMSQEKRAFWAARKEWILQEFSPRDFAMLGVSRFVEKLLAGVEKAGISYRRRSEEEIWELIRERALDGFSESMVNFVGRCRKRNLGPDDLREMVARHTSCSAAESLFLEVGVSVYEGYLTRLSDRKKEDFDGLLWRAVSNVREGKTCFIRDKGRERGDVTRLRFVLIDEFQDFSEMFFQLVSAIRSRNPRVEFFCVGDDWQAINAFAGSDLGFIDGFASYFRNTIRRDIRTNYRSPKAIVNLGNALMDGRGQGAISHRSDAGLVNLCKLDSFKPSLHEQARHGGDEITPALLRLVRNFLNRGLGVALLSRRKGIPWYVEYKRGLNGGGDGLQRFLEHIRSFLPREDQERVTASTVHRYKGLEQSAVIVMDAVQRSYPLIHPNWVFLRVFGDRIGEIENEERRLFYVAITRANDSLALLTESSTQSPYLRDIFSQVPLASIMWDDLPPLQPLSGSRVEIRVFDAYGVKDQLKDLKYRWDSSRRCWHRTEVEDAFSFASLLEQPWAKSEVVIEVYSETGDLLHRR